MGLCGQRSRAGRSMHYDQALAAGLTWKAIWMGGRAQGFFSLVVAMSSTEATRALSVCPVKRLIFQTRQCFLLSYLALPAGPPQYENHFRKRIMVNIAGQQRPPHDR